MLPKIGHDKPEKMTYTHGSYSIHFIAEAPSAHPEAPASAGGLTFLVVADGQLSRRVCFAFLDEARRRFLAAFPPGQGGAGTSFEDLPNYGCGSFNGDLRQLMTDFGRQGAAGDDALGNVRRDMDDVRGIMSRNIEGLLERGERIDLLVDKTDRLGGNAREFRVRSRGLRRQMWWKNVKLMSLLGLVTILIIMAIVIAVKNSVG